MPESTKLKVPQASSKKKHPATKKLKVTPKPVSRVTKRKAGSAKSGAGKKLVVKLNFSSGRRSIKRPARYSSSPDLVVVKTEKVSEDVNEEPTSPRTPKGKLARTKKAIRTPLSASKKAKKQKKAKSNSKSTKSISQESVKDSIAEEIEVISATNDQEISLETAKPENEKSETSDTTARQSRKRPASSPKPATPAKRGRKPKVVAPKVDAADSPKDQPISEEVEEEGTITSECNVEKATESAIIISEDTTVMDTNGVEEAQTEVVSDVPAPIDDDLTITETDLPQEELPIKSKIF